MNRRSRIQVVSILVLAIIFPSNAYADFEKIINANHDIFAVEATWLEFQFC